jgi:CrcB protein
MLIERIALVALAGSAGAVSRYLVSRMIMISTGGAFPWGTLAVNTAGCLLFGFIWGLAESRGIGSERTRLLFLVGFLGAFTTFSSFAHETIVLLREGNRLLAAANIVAQNLAGLAAIVTGFTATRLIP